MSQPRISTIHYAGGVTDPIYEPVPSLQRKKPGDLYRHTLQYWGKKPWNVVQQYIRHFAPERDSLIADPYAGGGVTLGESLRNGRRAIGMDVQPLAQLINCSLIAPVGPFAVWNASERIKQAVHPLVDQLARENGAAVAEEYLRGRDLSFLDQPPPRSLRRPGAETYLQTFDPRHLAGLLATRSAIESEENDPIRTVLWLAFANMLRYANRAYVAKYGKEGKLQPWSGDHALFTYKRSAATNRFTFIEFGRILDHCLERVYDLKTITQREFGEYTRNGDKAWFFRDDAARLSHYVSEVLDEGELDYVLMDPPYSDLVRYDELSTYWNIWLPDRFAVRATPLEAALAQGKDAFAERLSASITGAASVLKHGSWLTLFYLDIWDFGLWHRIIDEAADARLEHVNSTWHAQQIRSATQIQNPLSGIQGAVIANFRRVRSRVRRSDPSETPARPLQTPLVYLGHQLQRIIVENLGATTSEVLGHLSDEIYTRFALDYFAEGETRSVRELLQQLGATELQALQSPDQAAPPLWVLRTDTLTDSGLDLYERLRYHLFVQLAQRKEASAAELLRSIYEGGAGFSPEDLLQYQVDALLSTFARPSSPTKPKRGGWRIDWKGRFRNAQLRLLLSTTTAHHLREQIGRRKAAPVQPLHVNFDGFRALAGKGPDGAAGPAWQRISQALHLLTTTIRDSLNSVIASVWAVREFAEGDWDRDQPQYDDLPLLVLLRDSVGDPVEVEEHLLESLFGRLYRETQLNFVPFFRSADDADVDVLFGREDQRVLLIGKDPQINRERASA